MDTPKQNIFSIFAIIIIIASCLIYLQTLPSGFLWDDIHLISHPLRVGGNPYAFFFGGEVYYRPLIHLSMNFDYSIWHLNPVGYHITNVVLHTANSILVFFLCFYLFRFGFANLKDSPAELNNHIRVIATSLLAAVLFALHPIHTESVAWISGRTDVLTTFFFLLAFISYLTYENEGRPISLFLSGFFFSARFSAKKMPLHILA